MANGDISAIKVLYRHAIGGGQTSGGVAKNDKVMVVGEITATWADAGIAVDKAGGATAFGTSTLDFIKFQSISVNNAATVPTAEALQPISYDHTNSKIFIVADEGASTPVNPMVGEAVVFRFVAIGDDAGAPVLT